MERKPTFFWQGALILLPLVLLLAVGIYSLRQDRGMAEIEAKERCQQLASDLLRPLATRWHEVAGYYERDLRIEVDSNGQLLSIAGSPSRAHTPAEPKPLILDQSSLSSSQAHLWAQAREAEFATNSNATLFYLQFVGANPPSTFLPIAKYSLALNIAKSRKKPVDADRLFAELQTNTQATSEAGLPLYLLAGIQRLQLATDTKAIERFTNILVDVCSNAVEHPSIATPTLLSWAQELEQQCRYPGGYVGPMSLISSVWQSEWQRDEEAREFYSEAASGLRANPRPGSFWLMWQGSPLLVIVTEETDTRLTTRPLNGEERSKIGHSSVTPVAEVHTTGNGKFFVTFLSEDAVRASIVDLEKQEGLRVPDYAEAAYQIGDRWLIGSPGKGPLDATSSSSLQGGGAPVTISVHVAHPNLLYARQRQRTWLFAGLIAISGLAACIGLVSAHRGFGQQLRLNEMKSNFVSSVSHELRAPIASVRLLAEALDRGAVSEQPKQKQYFHFIVQECRRLTGLIENVLDFSRIEQGRKQYQFEETDLSALVQQTVKLMQPAAEERGVTLELRIVNCELRIVCDGLAMQQALVNLIDNAIKHSPSGNAVVVMAEEIRNPQSAIRNIYLSVTDHGPGIPAEEHEKIFERFYRRGSELRRETQGIGIGLTIVKHVAEAHGGRVIVESAVGQGSRFTMELPAKTPEDK